MIDFLKNNWIYITAIIASIKWIFEYSKNLKWEKNKFLLERLEDFFDDPEVEQVNYLLDWNSFEIEINGNKVYINDDILFDALMTHKEKREFNKIEVYLRAIFDKYFDYLNEFMILSEAGMIDEKTYKRFMNYWFEILSGNKKNKPERLIKKIHSYMEFYGFEEVLKFVKKRPLYL